MFNLGRLKQVLELSRVTKLRRGTTTAPSLEKELSVHISSIMPYGIITFTLQRFKLASAKLAFNSLVRIHWYGFIGLSWLSANFFAYTRILLWQQILAALLRPKGYSPIHLINPCTAFILGSRSQMKISLPLTSSSSSTYRSF